MSQDRAYTFKEINRMRKCINAIEWMTQSGWQDPNVYTAMIEERLRTYMAGNVDPNEIFARYEEMFKVSAIANFG